MMSSMSLCLLRSNHAVNIGRLFLIPHRPAFSRNLAPPESSKFHEDREVDPVLNFLQIRRKTVHQCSWRSANIFDDGSSGARRRSNSPSTREVRNMGRAVIKFAAKSNVLAGHVVKRAGSVPRLERVSRIFGEVRRT